MQVAVREAQFPGVPTSSSPGLAKTTTTLRARSDLAAPASAMATTGGGAAGIAVVAPHVAGASPRAGRKTVQRCFVEHLRANLDRHPQTAWDVGLPSTLEPHYCCDLQTIGTSTPTDLTPLHPNVHDPQGADGVAGVVELIKANSDDLTQAEIAMRARAADAAVTAARDDVSLVDDECVVSLRDPMSSQRMTAPGKGAACEHVECFDLVTFLRATLRATRFSQRSRCADPAGHPKCHPLHTEKRRVGRCDYCKHWRCPICRAPIALSGLRYDAFLGDVLAKTDAERVKVKPSASRWEPERLSPRPPPRDNETDIEEEEAETHGRRDEGLRSEAPAPARRSAAGAPRAAGPAIVIDLEAEEEEPAPVPAPAEDREEEAPAAAPVPPPPPPPAAPPPTVPVRAAVVPAPIESPRAKRPADTSPPTDPRRRKAPRGAAVTIPPADPVGSAARPTSTINTPETLAPPFEIPRLSASAADGPVARRPRIQARDPPVDPNVFARVGAVLTTVANAFGGADARAWCERAAVARSVERRALKELMLWVDKSYAHACTLRHRNRDGLKAVLTRHHTGDAFQKFRKLVREKRLRETAPAEVGAKIHRVLEFMSHTRDVWKAIVRKEELPNRLPLNKDGSYKTPPMPTEARGGRDAGEGERRGGHSRGSHEANGRVTSESKSSKASAKEKKRALAELSAPPPGAAKKFAANVVHPSSAAAKSKPKPKQKRRLPSSCDARGHGHCEWNRKTPLKSHPKLKHVAICEGCYAFYYSTPFNVDRDGYYEQCRCCSDGSEHLVCCDECTQVFCRACISNLGGKAYAKDVDNVNTWRCFSCDPEAVAKGR